MLHVSHMHLMCSPQAMPCKRRWMNGSKYVMTRKWIGVFNVHQPTFACDSHVIRMHSVSHLLDVLRQAVENEEKLLSEVTLPGVKFEIREVNTHYHIAMYCVNNIHLFSQSSRLSRLLPLLRPQLWSSQTPPTSRWISCGSCTSSWCLCVPQGSCW